MWIVDLDKKIVHDMSRPQYECHISKIDKERRKKIYTMDGVKRYIDDPLNKGVNACQYCMPDLHEFDMTSIYQST
jgi:hypothetical protein